MTELLITFTVTLHPGCRVDRVAEQAVSRHLEAHHAGHAWSCKETRVRPSNVRQCYFHHRFFPEEDNRNK